MATARDAVSGTVSSARDSVSGTLGTAVQRTRGAVLGGVGRTRAALSGSIGTILESRVGRLVSGGVDTALSTSESLVDQYLPGTEDELGESGPGSSGCRDFWVHGFSSPELEARAVQGGDAAAPASYYVRLECLSTRLRQRAYSRTVSKIVEARRRSLGLMTELQSPADLVSPPAISPGSSVAGSNPRTPSGPDPVRPEERPAELPVAVRRRRPRHGWRGPGKEQPPASF